MNFLYGFYMHDDIRDAFDLFLDLVLYPVAYKMRLVNMHIGIDRHMQVNVHIILPAARAYLVALFHAFYGLYHIHYALLFYSRAIAQDIGGFL
jgi:hypothetical protein